MLKVSLPLCLLFAVLVGCGDSNYGTVSGVVTLNGDPLPRGMVQFVPVNDMPTATAEIGPDGKYTLQTTDKSGAHIGKHKVRVEARAVPKDHTDTAPPSLIPERYLDESTSQLEYEVVPGKNTINIELKSP